MSGRTLVVTNDFPPRVGGIESFVLEMVRRMPPDSVVVHTARQEGDAEFDATLPFPVVRDRARLMLPTPGITRRTVATAQEYGCDSVWFGAAAPLGLMASALKRRAGVRRTVATTHGHEVWWAKAPGTRQLMRRIGSTNDVVTYLGEFTRAQIVKALAPEAAARMVQLTPGVDTERFHPGVDGRPVRERYALGDRPVIVCVSRFVRRKGQDMLIKALPLVHREVPDAMVLLVGDGPDRGRLEGVARAHGVTDHVVFAGAHPWKELPPFFAAGDVFAMPCRTRKFGFEVEGLGIVFLEAAATGLPVLAGNSGGAADAVRGLPRALVVDGRDVQAVGGALCELLGARERGETGASGLRQRPSHWDWAAAAGLLSALLGR